MIIEYADLHCTEGGADKVYHLALEHIVGIGWRVSFAYGRRGSTLKYGSKTNHAAVDEPMARRIYRNQLTIQYSKGYRAAPGISGNIFGTGEMSATTANGISAPKELTDHRPQLLNVIEENALEFYLTSEEWGAQEKMDGVRLAIKNDLVRPTYGINRKGAEVPLMQQIASCSAYDKTYLIDGEGIGQVMHAFDLLEFNGKSLRNLPYIDRYLDLSKLLHDMKPFYMTLVPLVISESGKRRLYERLRSEGAEGIVFKLLSAKFTEGRPNSGGDQVKFKFWESATCIVDKINDKRSIQVGVFYDYGGQAPVMTIIGNVTIPANHEIPSVGDIVEIRYLYYYPNGSLFQPQYEGRRTDMEEADCTYAQLKHKKEVSLEQKSG